VIRGGDREQGLKRIIDEEYCAVRAGCRLPAMASKRQEEEEEEEEYHKDGIRYDCPCGEYKYDTAPAGRERGKAK